MYNQELKFSLWCDFIERSFLENEFIHLIDNQIINAATSNPAIFKSAFLGSIAYAEDKARLKDETAKTIYEALAVEDIKRAALALLPLYKKGDDGFISIEVDPFLCDDVEGTIEEGKRLFNAIGYPNVMIKVPATPSGFSAMESLIAEGINVNATLIFSPEQTTKCLDAFAQGTYQFRRNKPNEKVPEAVISIFVSRFDRKMDHLLKKIEFASSRVGIMNALRCYYIIEARGLINVRTLFASTGVKGDLLRADYYIRELFVKNAINTAPLETIKAFIGSVKEVKEQQITSEDIDQFFNVLETNGITMQTVYDELMHEGIGSFKEAFIEILNALE